jgi:peptidyl-tRNA hydrolase, PTH2 family
MTSENPFIEDCDYRQVLVLRKDLKMRAGKLAAQAAHASMARLTKAAGVRVQVSQSGQRELVIPLNADLEAWVTGRFKKICVYVPGEAELLELFERVKAAGLDAHLVQDAGLTEFGGIPTHTFISIGPHPKAVLDPYTGHLPLY